MLCSYCFYAEPFVRKPAEFIINGQGVCEDHVDAAAGISGEFGQSLIAVQDGRA